MALTIIMLLLMANLPCNWGGFGNPGKARDIVKSLYGKPCDCGGGRQLVPGALTIQTIDCGHHTARLQLQRGQAEPRWVCQQKPQPKPQRPTQGGQCPVACVHLPAVNSLCYKEYSECLYQGKIHLIATLTSTYSGDIGGDWAISTARYRDRYYKLQGAGCHANKGDLVCWPKKAPLLISDGGGPTDKEKEEQAVAWVKKQQEVLLPPIPPPLKPRGVLEVLDVQLLDIMQTTHQLLNVSNPNLASDCWLCMQMTNSWPIAVPLSSPSPLPLSNCSRLAPIKVVPQNFETGHCYYKNSSQTGALTESPVDLGEAPILNCSRMHKMTPKAGCLPPGQAWVCGGNLGYSMFPRKSIGLCVPSLLLPYMDIVPGSEAVPIASIDYLGATRTKRAVAAIPLLVGLGVAGSLGLSSASFGVSMQQYTALAERVTMHLSQIHQTLQDLQDQHDSLAQVVLQNRRGLDLILAERHGLCAALNEECCFYANKSGIVKDRIRRSQKDLAKWKKELQEKPLWSLWGGILPYLLPLAGPLLSLLLLASIGPCIFNRILAFIKERMSTIHALVLTQQYRYKPVCTVKENTDTRV